MDEDLDKQYTDFDNRLYVTMEQDYSTSSHNLGERLYSAGKSYAVDSRMLDEIVDSGSGFRLTKDNCPMQPETNYRVVPPMYLVKRPLVAVKSKVSRWLSSNGRDTHYFEQGRQSSVPSNLAEYMVCNDLAERVTN